MVEGEKEKIAEITAPAAVKKRTAKWCLATSCMDGLVLGWQDLAIYLHIAKCNVNFGVKSLSATAY